MTRHIITGAIVLAAPFAVVAIGRGAYFALCWFNRMLGFTPDPYIGMEAIAAVCIGMAVAMISLVTVVARTFGPIETGAPTGSEGEEQDG